MSTGRELSRRLIELERILAQTRPAVVADADPVASHLAELPSVRIHSFTTALRDHTGGGTDDVDVLTMRLLLNDYRTAVGHLRAVARLAEGRMDDAAAVIRETQRFLRREEKLDAKRAAEPTA